MKPTTSALETLFVRAPRHNEPAETRNDIATNGWNAGKRLRRKWIHPTTGRRNDTFLYITMRTLRSSKFSKQSLNPPPHPKIKNFFSTGLLLDSIVRAYETVPRSCKTDSCKTLRHLYCRCGFFSVENTAFYS